MQASNKPFSTTTTTATAFDINNDDNLFDPFAELSGNRQSNNRTLSATTPAALSINPPPSSPQKGHHPSKQIPVLSKPPEDSTLFGKLNNHSTATDSNPQFSTNMLNLSTTKTQPQPQPQQNISDDLFAGLSQTVVSKKQGSTNQQQYSSDFGQFDSLFSNTGSTGNTLSSTSNQQILSQPSVSSQNQTQQHQQDSSFGFFQQNSNNAPRTVSSTQTSQISSSSNLLSMSTNASTLIPKSNSGLDDLFSVFSSTSTVPNKNNTAMKSLLNPNNISPVSSSFINSQQQQTGFGQNNLSMNSNNMQATTDRQHVNSTGQGSNQYSGSGFVQNTMSYSNPQGFPMNQNSSLSVASTNANQHGFGQNMNYGNATNNFPHQKNSNMNMMNPHLMANNFQQQSFRQPFQQQQQQHFHGRQSNNLNFINHNPTANKQPSNRSTDAFSFVQDAMKSTNKK